MKILFSTLCCLMLLASCYTKHGAIQRFCPTVGVKDSSFTLISRNTITNLKDSIVLRPATLATIAITNPCDSVGKLQKGIYKQTNGGDTTQLIISDSGIVCKSYCAESISRYQQQLQQLSDSITYYHDKQTIVSKHPVGLNFKWGLITGLIVMSLLLLFAKIIKLFILKKL